MSSELMVDESPVAKGQRLKRLRQLAGLQTNELATLAKVSVQSISYWENAALSTGFTKQSAVKIVNAVTPKSVVTTVEWLLYGLGDPPYVIPPGYQISHESPKTESSEAIQKEDIKREIELFRSSHSASIIHNIDHALMVPVFETGDWVGGIWQSSESLAQEKICIVEINNIIQVRKIKPGSKTGFFDASYLVLDSNSPLPCDIRDIPLKTIAPIIRVWR